jgi:hypothetical protein
MPDGKPSRRVPVKANKSGSRLLEKPSGGPGDVARRAQRAVRYGKRRHLVDAEPARLRRIVIGDRLAGRFGAVHGEKEMMRRVARAAVVDQLDQRVKADIRGGSPVSSRNSRCAASASVSPKCTRPPGKAHRSLAGARPRLTSRNLPVPGCRAATETATRGRAGVRAEGRVCVSSMLQFKPILGTCVASAGREVQWHGNFDGVCFRPGAGALMCGRFSLLQSPEEVEAFFALEGLEAFPPRYNIAPTQPILVIAAGPPREPGSNRPDREAHLVRWGLLPSWVKDPKEFPLLINARGETAATKASFRAAMRHRRALIPASGFYEWKRDKDTGQKQAYWVRPAGGGCAPLPG